MGWSRGGLAIVETLDKALGELGEEWVLREILASLSDVPALRLGVGDDAVELRGAEDMVVAGDMLVESTDVPLGMSHRQIGMKAVTAVASDFAAKGAEPQYFFVELGLPASMKGREFRDLWGGILSASKMYGGVVVGGDTNEAKEIVVGVVAIGRAINPISRKGARPGDILAVTGLFGKTYAGLHAAFSGNRDPKWRPLLDAVYEPRARLREGVELARAGLATSSIDSSDGLEACLRELSDMSGVGFIVERLPLDPLAEEYVRVHGLDLYEAVLRGGEEYELVLTVPSSRLEDAARLLEGLGCSLIPVGKAVEDRTVTIRSGNSEMELRGKGWRHFKGRPR
jgi:thiamine-monophosphate kinase